MLARDPGNVALRDDLLLMLTDAGRLSEAAEEAARSAALQPSSAAAQYNLGAALMAVGRMEQAAGAFEKAVAIDPDHVMALYNLALVMDVADREPAIRHLRRVLQLRPGWPPAQSSLAWHLARGEAERARRSADPRTSRGRRDRRPRSFGAGRAGDGPGCLVSVRGCGGNHHAGAWPAAARCQRSTGARPAEQARGLPAQDSSTVTRARTETRSDRFPGSPAIADSIDRVRSVVRDQQ